MRRVMVSVLAVVAALATATPSHAAPPGTLELYILGDNERVGNGVVASAVCMAVASPETGWTAVATSVRCTINGFPSPTVTTPTAVAVTSVANATTAPVTVCIYGDAIFSPTFGATITLHQEECVVTPVG